MNMSQELYERIERYLLGQLEGVEKDQFESELAISEALRNAVEEQKIVIQAIEEASLRETMQEIHSRAFDEGNGKEKVYSLWQKPILKYGIAASLGILFLVGGYTLSRKRTNNQDLYASYFRPDPGLPTTMSTTQDFGFYEAMVTYKQGNYKQALEKWEGLLKTKPNNDTLNYFIGVAHLANEEDAEAITFLQWATAHEKSVFLSDAFYYLGLAYLKQDNTKKAIYFLEKSEHKSSEKLINELKEK
ncbi:hypothetical protein GCM10011344_29950 [Dokdonia pacifica]|uniref:Tetratricopeptide repeat-containing protein n=1 Tax=Dokdonia pacifica TaxID=1627892 RepID=A0A239C0M7_9FLAO|nr:tetratricopeptide repeat protein [Dokdonia pacifica]GGG27184.1 hypothetical protein GCM10011344_29950 [Dokdonia pacifica]SNS13442.1 Tetratricopeptide repeat-containing protein [Dokdonia pacifica]